MGIFGNEGKGKLSATLQPPSCSGGPVIRLAVYLSDVLEMVVLVLAKTVIIRYLQMSLHHN